MTTTTSKELNVVPPITACRRIPVGSVPVGGEAPLAVIAGPCVMESEEHILFMATELKAICGRVGIPLIFKASYDKANRTSIHSFRGPGLEKGMAILSRVKRELGLPVLTDVHTPEEAEAAGEVCDILQIPAFLCRQTDFVTAVGRACRAVNVKKGQFLAPWDIVNVVSKLREVGCEEILLTERGTSFGYGSLITDFRALSIMQELTGLPVCFDATHSVQEPGALGNATGGQRQHVPLLSRAACAVGINALFLETHDSPDNAKSDGPNMVPLDKVEALLTTCKAIDGALRAAIV